jgi:hypothetical protein
MKELHGPPTSEKLAFRIRQNCSLVKRGIPDAPDARLCVAKMEGYEAIHCKEERALARREGDTADAILKVIRREIACIEGSEFLILTQFFAGLHWMPP